MSFRPEAIDAFQFSSTGWNADHTELTLTYQLQPGPQLTERIQFPVAVDALPAERQAALDQAVALLHWVAGISYWKTACPEQTRFSPNCTPDRWQARVLEQLYAHGLAEFAHRNQLDITRQCRFTALPELAEHNPQQRSSELHLQERALVPLGGGKDSLVALERLREAGVDCTVTAVRPAELITRVAAATGAEWLPIQRVIDPQLLELNHQGAWNGHVPITAINMAVLLVSAILYDFQAVVFANEASADEPTLSDADGIAINHQYSKSSEFEWLLQQWIHRYIGTDLHCFSILRPYSELAICQQFAALEQYHSMFSSCNRQFHLDGARSEHRWCGECPKCLFVFLGLAPFLSPARLTAIFSANLLDNPDLTAAFGDLCGLGQKPFECVGSVHESRVAMEYLGSQQDWRDSQVVSALTARLLDDTAQQDRADPQAALEQCLQPSTRQHIPPGYRHAAG